MLKSIEARRVWIHFNGADTIQRVILEGGEDKLLVMFDGWGVYDKKAPKPIRLQVNCGGFIIGEDEDGETTLGQCFLANQEGRIVLVDLETDIIAFTLMNSAFAVEVIDEGEVVIIDYPNAYKRKGVEDGFEFHVWELPQPIRIIVDDEQPYSG